MSFNSKLFLETIFSNKPFIFNELALDLFRYQATNNKIYSTFCKLLNCKIAQVNTIEQIPFLPISTFKNYKVITGSFSEEAIFTSSGTSGQSTSKHFVKEISTYQKSFVTGFEHFYGKIEDYCILGLLPSYLERKGSSLIHMVADFIAKSKSSDSGFFLENKAELAKILIDSSAKKEKVLLIGVSFGLLDFVEEFQIPFNENLIIMETGGMKGRRKEMIREELHIEISKGFSSTLVHSEYGMTELLSQAYSKGNGLFSCPPWMQVVLRKQDDPLSYSSKIKSGAINVIDLANINSCAFLATDDLGRMHSDNHFEVLGRFDASEVRGCNLMIV